MAFKDIIIVLFALVAFAANSLLCRAALAEQLIDPASFTSIRLASGAIVLFVLTLFAKRNAVKAASPYGAFALFVYAAGFSFAYIAMSAGIGALLLFGSVQVTMLAWGLLHGERFSKQQWVGFSTAVVGLVILLLPGISAPPLLSAAFMILAGIAWGTYSILGKGASSPLALTAGNFVFTIPLVVILSLVFIDDANLSSKGALYAVLSGAVASGLGYAAWYRVLPLLASTSAATIQLSVPVLATFAGWLLLGEVITTQIIIASGLILGGILLVIRKQ